MLFKVTLYFFIIYYTSFASAKYFSNGCNADPINAGSCSLSLIMKYCAIERQWALLLPQYPINLSNILRLKITHLVGSVCSKTNPATSSKLADIYGLVVFVSRQVA
jgi:hypothetical protein